MTGLRSLYRRWLPRRRPPAHALWSDALGRTPYAAALARAERRRLRALAALFLDTKSFEGAAGLAVTDAMRVRIAVKACVPILNLGLEYYSGWASIILYPGDFRVHEEYLDEYGVAHRGTADLCGQSLQQGPMVLSWAAIEDAAPGFDPVIHECAHKLDIQNGAADGFPPLHAGMKAADWTRDFTSAYDRLRLARAGASAIDPYAASDPAEFFAVLTEAFFTAPETVRREFAAVYNQLQAFYRQDPHAILTGARNP